MPIPKHTPLRVTLLIALLGVVYFGGFGILRYGMALNERDLLVALGTFTVTLFLLISFKSHVWLRWLSPQPPTYPERFAFVQRVVNDTAGRCGFPIELRIVKAKGLFIYSAGISNRMILISDKAVAQLSDSAILGVIAHEAAHMVLKHAKRNAFMIAALFGSRIAFSLPTGMGVYLVCLLLMMLRSHEYEADRVAALMVGTQPLLDALDEVQRLTKMKDFSRIIEFFLSTHPSYARRRNRIGSLAT